MVLDYQQELDCQSVDLLPQTEDARGATTTRYHNFSMVIDRLPESRLICTTRALKG
jgi:hypothetical protein